MIALKRPHQYSDYRTTIRRRLNDSSAVSISRPQSTKTLCSYSPSILHFPSSNETQSRVPAPPQANSSSFIREQQPRPLAQPLLCLPRTTVTSLPQEILLQIFSNLPVLDLVRSSRACRKFYNLSHDKYLKKHLDLSNFSCHYLPSSIATSLKNAHSITIISGRSSAPCSEIAVSESLYLTSYSTHLTTITLRHPSRKFIPNLHNFFQTLESTKLTHVDLAGTPVPNHVIPILLSRCGNTLVSLNLEFSPITDPILDMFCSKNDAVPKLKELGLGGCMWLSKDRFKRFLSEDEECPVGIEKLDLSRSMDLELEWVEQWLLRRQKAATAGAIISGMVNVKGCSKVKKEGVEEMRNKWMGVEIKCSAMGQEK